MKLKLVYVLTLILWLCLVGINYARSAMMFHGSVSLMGSYSKTNFTDTTYSETKRVSAALAYSLSPVTDIELSFLTSSTFVNLEPTQTSTTSSQALSLSVVQSLVPARWRVQPYVKGGVSQFNRTQSGTIQGIPTAEISSKNPSALIGFGIRVYPFRQFSLKVEGVGYMPDFEVEEAKNNFAAQGGVGWRF